MQDVEGWGCRNIARFRMQREVYLSCGRTDLERRKEWQAGNVEEMLCWVSRESGGIRVQVDSLLLHIDRGLSLSARGCNAHRAFDSLEMAAGTRIGNARAFLLL